MILIELTCTLFKKRGERALFRNGKEKEHTLSLSLPLSFGEIKTRLSICYCNFVFNLPSYHSRRALVGMVFFLHSFVDLFVRFKSHFSDWYCFRLLLVFFSFVFSFLFFPFFFSLSVVLWMKKVFHEFESCRNNECNPITMYLLCLLASFGVYVLGIFKLFMRSHRVFRNYCLHSTCTSQLNGVIQHLQIIIFCLCIVDTRFQLSNVSKWFSVWMFE